MNVAALTTYFSTQLSNTVLGLYNAMSGSAFSQATVFALGIQPNINASIIIELLCIAIPPSSVWRKDGGEEGKKKIQKITLAPPLGLGLLMGFAYCVMLKRLQPPVRDWLHLWPCHHPGFTAGASLPDVDGRGRSMSSASRGLYMILFVLPSPSPPPPSPTNPPSHLAGDSSLEGGKVRSDRDRHAGTHGLYRVHHEFRAPHPVQYAKRVVGRKMYGGQSTNLPIKVNMSGVLPIIFAQSIASLPATIVAFTGTSGSFWTWMNKYVFDTKSAVYIVCYFLLIIAFSYFYATVQFNPIEIANNLKKNGGFIPGFRPGKPTSDFILKVINKITLFGALYLAIIAILPIIVGIIIGNSSLAIGGTSVIIVVGVALDTVKALEAQMLMRHYKGFLE